MNPRQLGRLLAVGTISAALLAASPAPRTAAAGPDDGREIACLALTIYHEARGESERGKLAVGHVVMNRTHSALFPAGVCEVVEQGGVQRHRCQFSWWCDGRSDRPKDQVALRESTRLAEEIYYGCAPDPTAGALWYHAVDVRPSWSKSFGPGKRIDGHLFYRGGLDRPIRIGVSSYIRGQCPPTPETRPTLLAGS